MKKWNLIVDVAECHNCHNCFIACKDEYVGNDIEGYSAAQPLHGHRWIDIKSKERGEHPRVEVAYVPVMCNHCDDAPCIQAGGGAVSKRDDGIVIIDPDKAKGRQDIVQSCPYGAIWWNEELSLPQAWTFDAHLLDRGWPEPRCVQSCPTGALKALKVEDSEMTEIAMAEGLEPINSEFKTKPRVHYKNLDQFNRLFVAGEVLGGSGGNAECLDNAEIVLRHKGVDIGRARTDPFGEFLVDGIAPGIGDCTLTISHDGYSAEQLSLSVSGDCVILETVTLLPTGGDAG